MNTKKQQHPKKKKQLHLNRFLFIFIKMLKESDFPASNDDNKNLRAFQKLVNAKVLHLKKSEL